MDWMYKCKTRNYKTLREKHKQDTLCHKSQQDPLWSTFQSNRNKKKKIKKWDQLTVKAFAHEGKYMQGEKVALRMRENNSKKKQLTKN